MPFQIGVLDVSGRPSGRYFLGHAQPRGKAWMSATIFSVTSWGQPLHHRRLKRPGATAMTRNAMAGAEIARAVGLIEGTSAAHRPFLGGRA